MKVTATQEEPKFQPVQLTLTFETLDEVKEFYSIFNTTCIADTL